jgi:hypothetical protein
MAKYDDMSFGKAFAAARKEMGKGKTFTWRGKSYTADYKEEAAANKKKDSVPAPQPRPSTIGSKTTETSRGEKTYSGRGSGSDEVTIRRAQAAIDRSKDKNVTKDKSVSYDDWKNMSRTERKNAGLPVSSWAGAMHAFKKAGGLSRMSGETKMAKGGMAEKGTKK